MVGKQSPRAYFDYDMSSQPDAKYFRQILENSLCKDDISRFCSDFLGLLRFQKKGHKEKV